MRHNPFVGRYVLVLAAVALVASAVLVAGCGSSSSSSSSTTGSVSASASSSGGGSSAASVGLREANAVVAAASKQPTSIGTTVAVGKPVPKGKTIDWISCGVPVCNAYYNMFAQAAKALGWHSVEVQTNGTVPSISAAWQQAVRNKPDAVVGNGFDRSIFNPEIKQLTAEGAKVVNCCTSDTATDGISYVQSGNASNLLAGAHQAAWVTHATNGKANAVFVTDPDFPSLVTQFKGFQPAFKKYCPNCQLASLPVSNAALGAGTVANSIVAYLRSHSSINYVVLALDTMGTGLPEAIKQAGLSVPFMGLAPDFPQLAYIKSGEEQASIEFPGYENQWSMANALARLFAGESAKPAVVPLPERILTGKDVQSTSAFYPVIKNLPQQYEKLWGVPQTPEPPVGENG